MAAGSVMDESGPYGTGCWRTCSAPWRPVARHVSYRETVSQSLGRLRDDVLSIAPKSIEILDGDALGHRAADA